MIEYIDGIKHIERVETTQYDVKYTLNLNYANILNENIKNDIDGIPINKKMPYNRDLMIKAINNGMIILILYRGDKDNWKGGRERVIYPMVLGVNKNTKNELLRAWHFTGYSLSKKGEVQRVWRLFKTSNILSMMFIGDFYRLPPEGYKMNDRAMTERIIAKADFNKIRYNQDRLLKKGEIEKEEKVTIKESEFGTPSIMIKNTNTTINLKNPFNNIYLKKLKNTPNNIKITILYSSLLNEYIAILGIVTQSKKIIKVFDENKKLIGNYRIVLSFTGDEINKIKNVNNKSEFNLYLFIKRI